MFIKFICSKTLLFILLFSMGVSFFFGVSGGSVSNQFRSSYKAYLKLEEKGLLQKSRKDISPVVLEDINFLDGYYSGLTLSESFERYIKETDEFGGWFEAYLKFSFLLFVFLLYFRMSKYFTD